MTYAADTTVVRAIDFGVRPNSFENASAALQKALLYCKDKPGTRLELPAGRIDLWPEFAPKRELYISNGTENDTLSKEKSIGLLLEGFRQLHIRGEQTLIVLHGKMLSFVLLDCRDVTIEGIRFDYERPTMSELTIQEITATTVNLQVHPDSRYEVLNEKLIWYGEGWSSKNLHTILYDPQTELMRYSNFRSVQQGKVRELASYQLEVTGDFSKTGWKKGDRLTMRDPYRDNAGALIWRSVNTNLKDISMHYMHGLGIVSQFSENILFERVKVAPAEGSGRIIASFADCFHFSGCKGSIVIDQCFTSGAHDDPINVHGTHLKVKEKINSHTVRVEFMHHQTYGLEAFFKGDAIAYIKAATLLPYGSGIVKRATMINKRIMELEMETAIPEGLNQEFVLENITWTPSLTIRNSHFERTNTRGILVTTRKKVLIENNRFVRTGMHAILIANDASSWYESGPVTDVLIQNNRFEECGYNSEPGNAVISIAPENHELVPNQYVHRNIRIRNNYFKVYDAPLVQARSTIGLEFSGNTIEASSILPKKGDKAALQLTACAKVTVLDNTFQVPWEPTLQFEKMEKKNIRSKGLVLKSK
jgi:hypothetical protein